MLPFLAIVRLTCRSAIRSNVFRTLLFLLALSVILIPNTIKGDGTATGFIQLILEYSLGFSGAILAISVAWVCCSEIASDVESGQIHLIVVKPVPRPVVLLGKFTGVLVIHAVLLLIASAVVYGFVMYQFMRQDFPEGERQRVESEVLTGRRLVAPDKPDFAAMAEQELKHRLETARTDERAAIEQKLAGDQRRAVLAGIERELRVRNGEVEPGGTIFWTYSGLSEKEPDPLFLRYKLYAGTDLSKNQETTYGAWLLRFVTRTDRGEGEEPEYTDNIVSLPPEEIMTRTRDEFGIQDTILRVGGAPDEIRRNTPPELMKNLTDQLVRGGTFVIGFQNYDREGKKIILQEADGPFLMVRETGFLNNYLRAVLVLFLGIAAVALVSSALAAYFTLPTSVFLAASYGLLCIFAVYLMGSFAEMGDSLSFGDRIARALSEGVFFLLIPVRDFFLTTELATGQLIDFARIGRLIFYNIVLRGLPLFLAGMLLYTRRELALAMKR